MTVVSERCGNDGRNTVMCMERIITIIVDLFYGAFCAPCIIYSTNIYLANTRAISLSRDGIYPHRVPSMTIYYAIIARRDTVPTQTPAHSHTGTYRHTRRSGYLTFNNIALKQYTVIGPVGAFVLG